jgi:hypothetical protein
MDDLAVAYQGQERSPETARVTASGAKPEAAEVDGGLPQSGVSGPREPILTSRSPGQPRWSFEAKADHDE